MSKNFHSPAIDVTICGIDELPSHSAAGVSHVLSILDPATPEPVAFASYGEHERLELRFHDVIESTVAGFDPPRRHHIESLLEFGRQIAPDSRGRAHVLVHCHMGISRSTAAAALLMLQAEPGRSPADIMAKVAALRAKAWPNLLMIELGDDILGLNGELVRAVRARHLEMARALPHVADYMRESGRSRELK